MSPQDLEALPTGTVVEAHDGSRWVHRQGIPKRWCFLLWPPTMPYGGWSNRPPPRPAVRYASTMAALVKRVIVRRS